MTGTTDLSVAQLRTIVRSVDETDGYVLRVVITPTTDLGGSEKPVVVKQYTHVGDDVCRSRYAVLRDGKRVPGPDTDDQYDY